MILTPGELKIAVALCNGLSNKEIAEMLGYKCASAEQMAKNHIKKLYKKFDVSSRMAFAICMYRNGLVQCPCGSEEKEAICPTCGTQCPKCRGKLICPACRIKAG